MWDPHEQLAEMLRIRNAPGDVAHALSVLEQQLAVYPNRYHALAGAGECADMLRNDIKASAYYGQVRFTFKIIILLCLYLMISDW